MRYTVLAAAVLLPATLIAQYPAVGAYKGYVQPVGTDGRFDLLMRVEKAADSTVINVFQDPAQPPLPLVSQYLISGGFYIEIVSLSCPMVVVAEEWEGICADPLGNPAFTLRFARKAEASSAAPPSPTPG
jgi:hypothetical protein